MRSTLVDQLSDTLGRVNVFSHDPQGATPLEAGTSAR
jgi:hypothetical protein